MAKNFKGALYSNLAYANHVRGNVEKATQQYEKAIATGAAQSKAYAGFSTILLQKGEFARALQIITEGLQRMEEAGKGNFISVKSLSNNYVIALWKVGRLDEAIDEEEKVHAEIASVDAKGTLGCLYLERALKTGEGMEQALAFNEAAYEYEDEDPVIADNLGQVYYHMGQLDKAAPLFEKALTLRPNQTVSMYYMAKIHELRGDVDKALNILSIALQKKYTALASVSKETVQAYYDELLQKRSS